MAGGVPIGDDLFVKFFVARKVDEVSGEIEQNHTLLRSVNAHDHSFQVIRLSDSHRLDYVAQVVSPCIPGVRDEYKRYDSILQGLGAQAVGVDLRDLDPATHSHPDLVRKRAYLPKRYKGMGIVAVNDVCLAAFVGAINMTIPRFPDKIDSDGVVVRGLAGHLESLVGTAEDFAVPQGRYSTFLQSGLTLARDFGWCWETMRTEAGADPAGVFGAAAADAPAPPRAEDVRELDTGRLRLQRLCTAERQRTRARNFQEQMVAVPLNDPIRMAYDTSATGELWTTLPRNSTAYTRSELSMAACIYLGLASPEFVAAINSGTTHVRDRVTRAGRPYMRKLDPYGQSLSMFSGKGNFRLGMHNAIERELELIARDCGLNVVRQDFTVFASAIPVGPKRNEYARSVRAMKHGDRGGIVPDLTVKNFPSDGGGPPRWRLYEVKTFGHNGEYGKPSALDPVTRREARIPGEYEKLARQADAKYCQTPAGVEGPILLHLRSLAPVYGLVVGANGEWSRGVDTFIADVSRKASANPERFGCCHGSEQARGVIAAMAKDRLGRVSLRAAAQVRIAALRVATGQTADDPSAGDYCAPGTGDEWDRARDNSHLSPESWAG